MSQPQLPLGGDPEKVRKSEADRFRDPKIVDEIIEIDERWRKCKLYLFLSCAERFAVDNLRKDLGVISKTVA